MWVVWPSLPHHSFPQVWGGVLCKSWKYCRSVRFGNNIDVGNAQHLLILLFPLRQQNHQLIKQGDYFLSLPAAILQMEKELLNDQYHSKIINSFPPT